MYDEPYENRQACLTEPRRTTASKREEAPVSVGLAFPKLRMRRDQIGERDEAVWRRLSDQLSDNGQARVTTYLDIPRLGEHRTGHLTACRVSFASRWSLEGARRPYPA